MSIENENANRNWFQKMPLHWKLLFYYIVGIVTGMLLLTSLTASAQTSAFSIERNGERFYCISEPLTDSLIPYFNQGVIDKKLVIELTNAVDSFEIERAANETALNASDAALDAQKDVTDNADELTEVSNEKVKRLNSGKFWKALKDGTKGIILFSGGALVGGAIGVGVGYYLGK